MKNKICFVVQRYGLEVNGGAELHCRQLAEHMLSRYSEVHVLTSKAVDYMTWRDEYPKALEEINGVMVHRFSVKKERNQKEFNEINYRFLTNRLTSAEELEWVEKQGPFLPDLIQYMRDHRNEYDVFIFCTYLYYQTVMGVGEVKDKAIVIPSAHDEPFLRMKIYDSVFLDPRSFFFHTEEECNLIHQRYHNENIPYRLGGAGVEVPAEVHPDEFKKKYKLDNYVIYVGRIDEGKNCNQLFDCFLEYKKRNPGNLKLVLLGKAVIKVPKNRDIVSLGFVDDQDKFDGIAGAKVLILPSEFESLSMVVLEAMTLRTVVMVNGKCPVLKGHCIKSNGAFYYNTFYEFEAELIYLLSHPEIVDQMTDNAQKYVRENYQWNVIVDRLSELIEQI